MSVSVESASLMSVADSLALPAPALPASHTGHTSPAQALRGGRCLGLIAVRIRPPNGLSHIYQGSLESLYSATFNPPLRCLGPLISHEGRYSYPLPTGCYETDLKVFRRLHLRSGGVQAFTALRKFITITVQRFLRRKRNQRALTGSASLFLISQ